MHIFKAILLMCLLVQAFCEQDYDSAEKYTVNSTDILGNSTSPTSFENDTSTKSTIDTEGDSVWTTILPDMTDIVTEVTNETSDENTTFEQSTSTTEVTLPEINQTACSNSSCKNGGTCLENVEYFSCECNPGYTGARCGTVDNCEKNDDGETCYNGTCVHAKDGSSRFCKCYTGTYWDNTQKMCRPPEPPCFPNPCDNKGVCEDHKGEFKCHCQKGYEGPICSIRNKCGKDDECPKGKCILDEEAELKYCKCRDDSYWNEDNEKCEAKSSCTPNPCKHSGECQSLQDQGFNCTCPEGFSGHTCEITDYCTTNDNCNGGECELSKYKDYRLCRCKEGFYLDETSHFCKEKVEPCLPNPCANDGICKPVDSTNFNCTCSEGYVGERCTERDLCVLDGGNTYCGETPCLTHSKLGVFYCSCPEDQFFDYAERTCKDLNLCPLVYCDSNEYCEKGACHCKQHFKWNNETGKCESNFCASDPCPGEHMECKEDTENEGYQCFCKEGYAYDGDACKKASCIFPHLNLCNQKCESLEDGYLCDCHQQFELKDNTTCLFVGNVTCNNKTCENGACVKTDEDETCICPPGYSEVNGKCVDDCTTQKLPQGFCPGDRCEAVSGMGFRCKCEGKYVLSADKVTCARRKMCRENEVGWISCSSLNATCNEDWSNPEGFRCECVDGQIQTSQGLCQDICSTEKDQRLCAGMGAICNVDHEGQGVCRCPAFFQMNDRGDFCNKPAEFSFLVTMPLDVDTYQNDRNRIKRSITTHSEVNYHKIQMDVHATMRRLFAEFERVNVLNCEVRTEYLLCKMELQFQQVSRQDLNRIEMLDLCVSKGDDDSSCLLPPSLVLRKDKIKTEIFIETTDPCDEDVKENLCGSETACSSTLDKKTFNCTCKAGFVARSRIYPFKGSHSFIEVCKDVDECEEGNPCPENSKCANDIGSYKCSCLAGYRVASDATQSDELKCVRQCDPSPCLHGQCTERGDHGFDCSCDAGFSGATCDLRDENFKKARLNTIIVGAVLGGVLLLTIILFVASVTKLRKKKYLDDPSHMLYNAAEMTERRPADSGAINNAFQRD